MRKIVKKVKEHITLKGVYTLTLASIVTPEQKKLYNEIERKRELNESYIDLVRKLNELCKTRVYVVENVITTVGKRMIANNLSIPTPDNDMKINYSALGTGNTSPSAADVALETETYRRTIASSGHSSNSVNLTAFYGSTEVSGTFNEIGVFSDATATTDSGILFSRTLLNSGAGLVKSTSETLTIDYTITIG